MPQSLQGVSQQLGQKYNIDPALIDAVAQQESGYGKASNNVMQVNGMDKSTPRQSMEQGAKMLANYMHQYGDVELALAAYNMGPGVISFMQQNGILDPRQGMRAYSEYQKRTKGYKVYGDPDYIDHVMRYYNG
ncbi:MAG: transglycosylase SLT domain-containing protein [Acidobacterium ailaaui]|nr:transglycosylase SLT domain-containing protein [Pseudacidobacterium ailaaui]